MARLEAPTRDGMIEDERPHYDAIVATRGAIKGPFTVLLHSADLADRIADVGAYIRFESELPFATRCLAAIMVARDRDCRFEWAGWAPQAKEAGIPDHVIEAIAHHREPEGLDEALALVYSIGTQLLGGHHRVDDNTYQASIDQFGVKGTVELTATFGYFALLSFALNTFEVDVPEGRPILPERDSSDR